MKRFITLLLLLVSIATTRAYDFMVDDLCYNYNDDGVSVSVTYEVYWSDVNYSDLNGNLNIPSNVVYNGKNYIVKGIDDSAFARCKGITSVHLPNTIEWIARNAFCLCSNLAEIGIPDSVYLIYGGAFYSTQWYNNQPDGLVYAGQVAYKYKGTMPANTSIILKNGCVGISEDAFNECVGLVSISIPNSVKSILSGAFRACTKLTHITIPNSLIRIDDAFTDCIRLSSVIWNADSCKYANYPFYNSKIETIVFGNNVKNVPNTLCCGMRKLTNVLIPNSVTNIGDYSFAYCTGLTSIVIPNNVKAIGNNAFEECSGLTEINIPNKIQDIKEYTFYNCASLTTINIPNSVKTIECRAFYGCTGLTSLTIPNSATYIGYYAFSGCTGLVSLYIPNSLTSIDYFAFADCIGLKDIYCNIDSPGNVLSNTIFNNITHCNLYVPIGTGLIYYYLFGGQGFVIMEYDFSEIENVVADGVKIGVDGLSIVVKGVANPKTTIYDLNGRTIYKGSQTIISVPQHGIYIIDVNGKKSKILI